MSYASSAHSDFMTKTIKPQVTTGCEKFWDGGNKSTSPTSGDCHCNKRERGKEEWHTVFLFKA
jgi:hypothetical protein